MFDFRNYEDLVDWADTVLVDWMEGHSRDYTSFQDMVDHIYVIPLGINDYATIVKAEQGFMNVAQISNEVWDIFIESTKPHSNYSIRDLYRQFLLHHISNNTEKYKRIWNKYHG